MTGLLETHARIERILRGEDITKPAAEVGKIPHWYLTDSPYEVSARWCRMWGRMRDIAPQDEWFYLGNAIGWASR